MRIAKSLESIGLLIKSVSKTIKNEAKEQKYGFFGMLLGSSGVSLLGNLLTSKGEAYLEHVKEELEQPRVFNAASP